MVAARVTARAVNDGKCSTFHHHKTTSRFLWIYCPLQGPLFLTLRFNLPCSLLPYSNLRTERIARFVVCLVTIVAPELGQAAAQAKPSQITGFMRALAHELVAIVIYCSQSIWPLSSRAYSAR